MGPTPCPASVTCNWVLPSVNTQIATTTTTTSAGAGGGAVETDTPAGAERREVVGVGVVLGAVVAVMGLL